MIRVLQVIEGLEIGGAETMIINLHKAIDRSIIQFDYIITNQSKNQAYIETVKELGGKVYIFPAFNGKNIFQVRNTWNDFFEKHKEYKIIHTHLRSYASLFIPIAKKHGLNVIVHSHSISNGTGLKSVVKGILQYPLRWQADYFMGCSIEAGEWLFGKNAAHGKRFIILKNAIDCDKYTYNEHTRYDFRKKLNIEGNYVYIHVGRLHESKNHMFLLDVFKEIVLSGIDAKLLIIGEGDLRKNIQQKIEELQIENNVLLLGAKNNPYDYLQAADCFLFPSLWEGLGMSAIEAQAAGLRCICSNTIPNEVKVTNLCQFVSLDVNMWVKAAIENMGYKRENKKVEIQKAGYDITHTSRKLTNIYISISEKEKNR